MIVAVGLVAVLGFTAAPVVTAMTTDVTKVTLTRVAGDNDQVCPPGDSGKIDVSGNQHSVTVTAPAGKLISGYCVKAGSANQGLGPEFVTISPPQKTVTITHSSGKDISHYSLTFVDDTTTTGTHTTDTHTTG